MKLRGEVVEWEMAAASLHHNVLLDPEVYYECEDDCADANDGTIVRGAEGTRSGDMAAPLSY